jgi:Protein of unknown function (DUF2803).
MIARVAAILLLACATLTSGTARAAGERYRVDLVVFALPGMGGGEQPVPASLPNLDRAIDMDDSGRLAANHITNLVRGRSGLSYQAHRLANRGDTILLQTSWTQSQPPANQGPAIHLAAGPQYPLVGSGGQQIQQLDGKVTLHGGQLLYVGFDLDYTVLGNDGTPRSWHMRELRQVKLNKLHFIDGGGFGALVRVSRADGQN